jgi:hypothetical protein
MECQPETIKIGLSSLEPEDLIEDVFEKLRCATGFCVTPRRVYTVDTF